MITDKDFEEIWEQAKARDVLDEAAYNALTPEQRESQRQKFDAGFRERVSDDLTGDHDED